MVKIREGAPGWEGEINFRERRGLGGNKSLKISSLDSIKCTVTCRDNAVPRGVAVRARTVVVLSLLVLAHRY